MKIKAVVTTGFIVGMISNLWGFITCQWLFKWAYYLEGAAFCRRAMLNADTGWLVVMGGLKILIAILTTLGYALVYKLIPAKGVRKGLSYGFMIWLVGFLPSRLLLLMSTTIATGLIGYWIINDLVSYLIIGAIISALYRE